MSPYLADVLMHTGIGAIFACTGACTRHLCQHRVAQILLALLLIVFEASVMVKVVG